MKDVEEWDDWDEISQPSVRSGEMSPESGFEPQQPGTKRNRPVIQ